MIFFPKGKIFRLACLPALCALLIISLCACTEIKAGGKLTDDVMLTVGEEECSYAEAVMRLLEAAYAYKNDSGAEFWNTKVGGLTMEEYVKETAKDELVRITAAVEMADERAIYLTQEEQTAAKDAAGASFSKLSEAYDLSSLGVTQEAAQSLYLKKAFYDKLYSYMSEDVLSSVSEADCKVIEVNYVLLPEDTAQKDAQSFRDEVASGSGFEYTCTMAGYEPVMRAELKKGEMPDSFEQIAFNLTDGEIGELVSSDDGYYVIECVEDWLTTESAENYNSTVNTQCDALFEEAYKSYAENTEYRFNDELWETLSPAAF